MEQEKKCDDEANCCIDRFGDEARGYEPNHANTSLEARKRRA